MAILTTGVIDNTPVLGFRPSTNLQVRISNDDLVLLFFIKQDVAPIASDVQRVSDI
ncbi:hypothetical protein [Desulfosporosinus sp. SB140]|uniref:hypothetical protein n=1 Tax=Desulfosporosinus paludis TaxID=3115649 RepID=UPI00389046DF